MKKITDIIKMKKLNKTKMRTTDETKMQILNKNNEDNIKER